MIDPTPRSDAPVTFCPVTEFDLMRAFEKHDESCHYTLEAIERKFEVVWQMER